MVDELSSIFRIILGELEGKAPSGKDATDLWLLYFDRIDRLVWQIDYHYALFSSHERTQRIMAKFRGGINKKHPCQHMNVWPQTSDKFSKRIHDLKTDLKLICPNNTQHSTTGLRPFASVLSVRSKK